VIRLQEINARSPSEKAHVYGSLVPPAFGERFGLDPVTLTDPQGKSLARLEAPPGEASVRLTLRHRAAAVDPALFLRLDESRYGNLQITWVILSEPEGPRFGVDLDDEGNVTDLGARFRNLREEEAAMRAGLAPGQIRPGLRMLRAVLDRIEDFASRLGKPALVLEAFFYHNALTYERHGFGYLAAGSGWRRSIEGSCPAAIWRPASTGGRPSERPARGRPFAAEAGPSTMASCPSDGGPRRCTAPSGSDLTSAPPPLSRTDP